MTGNSANLPAESRGESVQEGEDPRISLHDHAAVSAELAEGNRSHPEVLETHGYSDKEWQAATLYWMDRLSQDVEANGAEATLPITYSDAYAKRQDELSDAPAMTPEQWAELQFDIEREGSPETPLANRQMSMADYFRQTRLFAKRLATDPELQLRFDERLTALRQ